jgi:excisionase family DNA binding protein
MISAKQTLDQLTIALDALLNGVAAADSDLNARHGQEVDVECWLSTTDAARVVRRSLFTVRQWCNHGRVHAAKTRNGRQWRIRCDELERYRREGLLPVGSFGSPDGKGSKEVDELPTAAVDEAGGHGKPLRKYGKANWRAPLGANKC